MRKSGNLVAVAGTEIRAPHQAWVTLQSREATRSRSDAGVSKGVGDGRGAAVCCTHSVEQCTCMGRRCEQPGAAGRRAHLGASIHHTQRRLAGVPPWYMGSSSL